MTDTKCCSPCGDTQLRPAAEFLAEYAAWLLGCGATCIRIEKNTRRMAERFGVEFDISIMPTHVVVSVGGGGSGGYVQPCVAMHKVAACGINFNLNARLSRLSWKVADLHLGIGDAERMFGMIKRTRPTGQWEVLLLASLGQRLILPSVRRRFHSNADCVCLHRCRL